ncbi:MAG: hypothetical protein FWG31_06600 [Oscillospiraceae bacterium]|nr:hypothetical protein [Oscillospiraceae bacterium]
MKKSYKTLGFALLMVVIIVTIVLQTVASPNQKTPWFIQPETGEDGYIPAHNPYDTPEEWASLSDSTWNNLALIQIPEKELASMPTVQLVKSCLNYVYFSDMYLSNSTGDPFVSAVQPYFNGFAEFFSRKDRGSAILSVYLNLDVKALMATDLRAELRIDFLYAMLRQYDTLNAMSIEERKLLLQTICERRFKEFGEGSSAMFGSDALIAARCLNTFDQTFQQKILQSPSLQQLLDMNPIISDDKDDTFAFDTMSGIYTYINDHYGRLNQ